MLVFQRFLRWELKVFLFTFESWVSCVHFCTKAPWTDHSLHVCLRYIFLLSLLSHAVEISDNIKHTKIINATRSVITQIHFIPLLPIYYFNIATSLLENALRDTFIWVNA